MTGVQTCALPIYVVEEIIEEARIEGQKVAERQASQPYAKEKSSDDLLSGQFIREIEAVYKTQEWIANKLDTPASVAEFLKTKIGNKTEEHFVAVYLDTKNTVTGWTLVSKGTMSESLVHPREIFKNAILTNSAAVIVAHNHPSGSLNPSREDVATTDRIREAGKMIGIPILDHVIITQQNYYSMREGGEIA